MLRFLSAAAIMLVCMTAADATPRHRPRRDSQMATGCVYSNGPVIVCRGPEKRTTAHLRVTDASGNRLDPRPRAWCGWQMRQWLGVADRGFNLARAWAHFGSRA